MRYHRNFVCLFLGMIGACNVSISQMNYPEIGKPLPNTILKNIKYYYKKQTSTNELKRKWLFLDFWNKYCSSCIASFPKVNNLRKEFSANAEFILIGRQDKENKIETIYERFRKAHDLDIPIVYDSVLHNQFGIYATPYIVIVDDKGIVRALTLSINRNDINEFLSGKTPVLSKALRVDEEKEISYDQKIPLLINGNGGNDTSFLYRSLLANWSQGMNNIKPASISKALENNRNNVPGSHSKFETLGSSLSELYRYAYFDCNTLNPYDSLYGSISKKPVFATDDTLLFESDWNKGKNIFSYSVIVPSLKANTKYVQAIMQADLKNYFGYDVSIEFRKMPYWKLVATQDAKKKLVTKGGQQNFSGPEHTGFTVVNYPVTIIPFEIWAYHQNEPPITDETGINSNIDFTIDAIMTDLEEIKKALQKVGLDLIKGEKEMKVLIIRK